jgi:VanZ family protein
MLRRVSHFLTVASRYLFWPGVILIAWGELRSRPLEAAAHLWDKSLHFTAYFGLAAMAAMVLESGRRLVWAILGVVALGGALEILQGLTGRDAEWSDMLANTLGALSGCGVAMALLALVARRGGD